MRKLLLALGVFSSLALGISLQGRGVDNTNCNTFVECLSENLPNNGGGGSGGGGSGDSGGGGRGSGGTGNGSGFAFKPGDEVYFDIGCSSDRIAGTIDYDTNVVTWDNTETYCLSYIYKDNRYLNPLRISESNHYASYFLEYSSPILLIRLFLTQQWGLYSPKEYVSLWDFPSGTVKILRNLGDRAIFHTIEDLGNGMRIGLYSSVSYTKPVFAKLDTKTESLSVLNIVNQSIGFKYGLLLKNPIWCDSKGQKVAKAEIPEFPFGVSNVLLHKCSGKWDSLKIDFRDLPANSQFRIRIIDSMYNHLIARVLEDNGSGYFVGREVIAIPFAEIGKCIEQGERVCFISYRNDAKKILDIQAISNFLKRVDPFYKENDFYIYPSINEGEIGIYLKWNFSSDEAVSFYGYFKFNNDFNIVDGYIARFKPWSKFYTSQSSDNKYKYYVVGVEPFKDTIRIPINFPYAPLKNFPTGKTWIEDYFLVNQGVFLYATHLSDNVSGAGILFPDIKNKVGGVLIGGKTIPYYGGSIFRIYFAGRKSPQNILYQNLQERDVSSEVRFDSFLNIGGRDYILLKNRWIYRRDSIVEYYIIYSPQFSR